MQNKVSKANSASATTHVSVWKVVEVGERYYGVTHAANTTHYSTRREAMRAAKALAKIHNLPVQFSDYGIRS